MNAERKPNVDTNRTKLADVVPLAAPFTVYIEPTRICNLKCYYCIHSTRDEEDGAFRQLGYDIKHLPFDDFLKIANDLDEFEPGAIKKITFSGLGEPLANPRLAEMVKIVADKKCVERIEVITNGILLNPKLIDELVAAGITGINISVQGNNAEQYEKVCGRKVDFDVFLENLRCLYDNRKNVKIYIKAVDATFESPEEQEEFYEIFSPMADRIHVEHIIPMHTKHRDSFEKQLDRSLDFFGRPVIRTSEICSQSFYLLQVGCDLDTFPCPNPGMERKLSMGNAHEKSLKEIWLGRRRKALLKAMLEFKRNRLPVCKDCQDFFICVNEEAEFLDDDAAELVKLFE